MIAVWNLQSHVNCDRSTAAREFAYPPKGSRSFYMQSAENEKETSFAKEKVSARCAVDQEGRARLARRVVKVERLS
jgi:hypothetical protein